MLGPLVLPCLFIGDRRSALVKVLCYKSVGRWLDSWWWHWNFFYWHWILPMVL